MSDGPNIARVAGLIGDHARAEVLTALLADRALTATELAGIAGVTRQTISGHLGKLLEAGLLAVEHQGRHRYFRLADRDVAQLLESLMGVAFRTGSLRLRPGPREPALRKARVCYDHLAGELGVLMYEGLVQRRILAGGDDGLRVTRTGNDWLVSFGIDVEAMKSERRTLCRPCLDWGERRHHLGGAVGAALLDRLFELRWASRVEGSRVVAFTPRGELSFRALVAS
ncbi:MAG: helix-turn-helix domain-containing protein [Caldimonas sp.]|nr:helix-turn-helix domain-containing protein [Pseudomonadota bacterium]